MDSFLAVPNDEPVRRFRNTPFATNDDDGVVVADAGTFAKAGEPIAEDESCMDEDSPCGVDGAEALTQRRRGHGVPLGSLSGRCVMHISQSTSLTAQHPDASIVPCSHHMAGRQKQPPPE